MTSEISLSESASSSSTPLPSSSVIRLKLRLLHLKSWVTPSLRMQRKAWVLLLGLAYIALNLMLGGLNSDQVFTATLCVVLHSYNEKTRHFLMYFFPLLLTGAIYDSLRYYYWQGISGHIYVRQHYDLDRELFGVWEQAKLISLPEYFDKRQSIILDLLCGFAYLVFVAEYLSAAFWLYGTKRLRLLKRFSSAFFLVNVIGFVTYFIFPAAPPWYLSLYGFGEARLDVKSNAAAAVRFDQILGTHFFDSIYGRGIDVYGSIPSLHIAYPLLVSWVAWKEKKLFIPAICFYFLMCFSAVYLQHHHVVDILLGSFYTCLTIFMVNAFFKRQENDKELLNS